MKSLQHLTKKNISFQKKKLLIKNKYHKKNEKKNQKDSLCFQKKNKQKLKTKMQRF